MRSLEGGLISQETVTQDFTLAYSVITFHALALLRMKWTVSFCSAEADPNYRPVFGGTETSNTSRIPVKSVTANKFERAHKKQFMK